jgi:hypothetical protein
MWGDILKSSAKKTYVFVMRRLPPAASLKLQYFRYNRTFPDLENPKNFNEKLLRRKLIENSPDYVYLADKVLVKDFVEKKLGEKYIIPTLWHGTALPDDIDQWKGSFVIKSNHSSGWNIFVFEGKKVDWRSVREQTAKWLSTPWHDWLHERWYNRIERQILIEPFIGEPGEAPPDYKFFVFDGAVKMVQVDIDRFGDHKRALFSPEWERFDVSSLYPIIDEDVARPIHLTEMIAAAGKLGEGFSFVRVDFYDLPDGPRFGEMTFAPDGGIARFNPESFNLKLGEYWKGPIV